MVEIRRANSILEFKATDWETIAHPDFPFIDYHLLRALETTDCLGDRTGWHPRYLGAWRDGHLVGALILYLKTNSYGEYIFDFAWANAYHQCGLNYYPKLTSAIPFTPATGPKLLLANPQDEACARELLSAERALAQELGVNTSHALFISPQECSRYRDAGFFIRDSFQFHWTNPGDHSFAQFLNRLRSKRRREILRERAQVTAAGISCVRLTGELLNEDHGRLFHDFYLRTIDKRSSFDYLTEAFFLDIFRTLKNKLLLVLAFDREHRPVAGALNYVGTQTLYGRHWGCLDEYRALHFEVCYYQGLEFALEREFKKFEAGAQGEHKLQRGFLPSLTFSAHRISPPPLDKAIRDFVLRERQEIEDVLADYAEHSPFKDPS